MLRLHSLEVRRSDRDNNLEYQVSPRRVECLCSEYLVIVISLKNKVKSLINLSFFSGRGGGGSSLTDATIGNMENLFNKI